MSFEQIISLLGALALLLTALAGVWGYFSERRKAAALKTAAELESDEQRAARIDARQVAELERLGKAYDALSERFTQLEEEFRQFREKSDRDLRDARNEAQAIRDKLLRVQLIVRRWWEDLARWEAKGESGPMPRPPQKDMHELELELAHPPDHES